MAGEVEEATFDGQGIVWGLQILSAKESCGKPARQRSTPESIVKSAGRSILRFSGDLGFPGHSKKLWATSINRGKKPRALQSGYRNFAGEQLISTRPCLSISMEQDSWATIFWPLSGEQKTRARKGRDRWTSSYEIRRHPQSFG